MFSQKSARRRFSRIFVQEKSTQRHLDFWPPFCIFLQPFNFSKKYEYFFIKKNFYRMEKSLFVDFSQFFENKKSKIHHLGLCRHFERFPKRSSTKC
jgi:hypothetical protein